MNRYQTIRTLMHSATVVAMTIAGALTTTSAFALDASKADPSLNAYVKSSGVSGRFSSIGSDTMNNLMTLWAEAFKKQYPNVQYGIQGAGSATAPPALTEGTSSFGPMSRAMKDDEIEAFQKKYGYQPTAIRVAIDALAVYVHKDNPLKSLTMAQVDGIFSQTRRCAGATDATNWGALGLSGNWAARPIQLYGRNSVSGTYGFFKQVALCGGDYKNGVNEQPGSASVVQSVSSSLNGIGYSGIGSLTSGVRALALAKTASSPAIEATAANALNNTYPLHRYLLIYLNKKPGTALRPLEREFLKFALSRAGQEVVVKDGYVPLSPAMVKKELEQLIDRKK